MVIGGTIADLDLLSNYFSPSGYLAFYRTYLHSLAAAILFGLIVSLPFLRRKVAAGSNPTSPATVFKAASAAAVLHLLLDACQSAGVELFWPFSAR